MNVAKGDLAKCVGFSGRNSGHMVLVDCYRGLDSKGFPRWRVQALQPMWNHWKSRWDPVGSFGTMRDRNLKRMDPPEDAADTTKMKEQEDARR